MVSSVVRSFTPWLPSEAVGLPGVAAATLSHTVCRMAPLAIQHPPLEQVPAVAAALQQLVGQSMALRSPTGGWPADLPQTPENLGPYLSEEVWELLEALDDTPAPKGQALVPIPDLVPQLLWMLASGGYEIMRLIEGVQARVCGLDAQGTINGVVDIVRLVPVLVLTVEEASYALDLVTQTGPVPPLYLAETAEIRLLENDLDSQPYRCGDLLGQIGDLLRVARPGLGDLLDGLRVEALRPFQPWQNATLRLNLHLAEMESLGQPQPYAAADSPLAEAVYLPPGTAQPPAPAAGFTLDDFANTLVDGPDDATAGVLGDWLTFTDEGWIQAFLIAYARRVMGQNLSALRAETAAAAQEVLCDRLVYAATDQVQGINGLFKHTFVHEPVLVADVWPRLRWYLAQSSERVMQLMGGVAAQVLPPGLSWQRGSLHLRPLMQLSTPQQSWIVDLSRGRLLPTHPQALPADAVVDVADDPWRTPLTVGDLAALVDRDLETYTPAIAALRQGTTIHLHRLDGQAGCQAGQLTLDWCFTLQTTL